MIYLDSDFLINCVKYKIDFFSKLKEEFPKQELVVFEKTFDELKNVGNSDAKIAIALVKAKDVKILKSDESKIVDNLILDRVKKGDIVATLDKELKAKLKEKGVKIISVRQKNYIQI